MFLVNKLATHTSGGILSKGWYSDSGGGFYLVKGSSAGNREWLSEVLASRLATFLGVPAVDYWIDMSERYPDIRANAAYVSVCRQLPMPFTKRLHDYMEIIFRNDKAVRNVVFPKYLERMLGIGIDRLELIRMLLFDALIGNSDRHVRNFEVYSRGNSVGLTPALDFGASLLYDKLDRDLKFSNGVGSDKAKPFADTHRRQVELLDRFLKIPRDMFDKQRVLDSAEYVYAQEDLWSLDGVSPKRREAITHYVRNRAEAYLLPFSA